MKFSVSRIMTEVGGPTVPPIIREVEGEEEEEEKRSPVRPIDGAELPTPC